jgi:F-type H+-transporting ATPase subunit gamma
MIVVTTDKGLCGGLNTNILRAAVAKLKELEAAGNKVQVTAIGKQGLLSLNRMGATLVSHDRSGDTRIPKADRRAVKVQLDAHEKV